MEKIVKAFIAIALILTALVPVSLMEVSSADSTTRLYVDPANIVSENYTPGQNIVVEIKVENAPQNPGVYGAQFRLEWNPSILGGVKIEIPPGHFMDPNGVEQAEGNLWIIVRKIYSDRAEYAVTYYDIQAAKKRGTVPRYGNGTLAKVTLKVLSVGRTKISLKDTILGDESATPIDHTVTDGLFDNRPPPKQANIYVNPKRVTDPSLTYCSNFSINVSITNASNLYRYSFKLNYDPTIIHAVNVTIGNLFPPKFMQYIKIDNYIGLINVTAWLTPPQQPVSGTGVLAIITFHVKGLGVSEISISDAILMDDLGALLPYTKEDGVFNNVLIGKIYVDPPEIIDPTMLPPSWFSIDIMVDDVEDLHQYKFTLTYDTAILTCYGVIIYPDMNGVRPSGQVTFNDLVGTVAVNVSLNPPANPITTYTPLPLVKLLFQVDSVGWSKLDIENTILLNSAGETIHHEVEDGFFMVLIKDLAVIALTANETEIYSGWVVEINVTIENQGDTNETFNVQIYYGGSVIKTLLITDLPSKNSITLTITWNTTGLAWCQNYTLTAHIPPILYELDTADNSFTDGWIKIRITGDVNGDGVVNVLDCVIASNAFASTPKDPRWNRWCDINRDNKVNILDFIRIAANFGRRC